MREWGDGDLKCIAQPQDLLLHCVTAVRRSRELRCAAFNFLGVLWPQTLKGLAVGEVGPDVRVHLEGAEEGIGACGAVPPWVRQRGEEGRKRGRAELKWVPESGE